MVFLGTLAVAVAGLLFLVFQAPGWFGLQPHSQPQSTPSDSLAGGRAGASRSPIGEAVRGAERGKLASTLGVAPGESGDPLAGAPGPSNGSSSGTSNAANPDSQEWLDGQFGFGGYSDADDGIPFAPRPHRDETGPYQRRPAVVRVPTAPTLPERIFEDGKASVAHVWTFSITPSQATGVPSSNTQPVDGWGSGLVWDHKGHIVTSRHVIENVVGAYVTLADGIRRPAKLVGFDDATDIAVLRVDASAESLTPIRVGTSDDLAVGMTVFSLACPYGLGPSLTTGMISGLNRSIRSTQQSELAGTIQTDTPLSPGSSGGALIDDQGRVIGMNAAIHRDSERAPGVGFVLPIDRLQETVPRLIEQGLHWYRDFGFTTQPDRVSQQQLRSAQASLTPAELPAAAPLSRAGPMAVPALGLVIAEVAPGSGADAAGLRGLLRRSHAAGLVDLQLGDVIVEAGGEPVTESADLERAIEALGPDEALHLRVARRRGTVSVTVERTPR